MLNSSKNESDLDSYSVINSYSKIRFKIWHIYSALFFLFLSFITLREFLLGDFIFEHRDFIWPYDLNNLFFETIYTINPVWTQRSLVFFPFLSFFTVLDLPSIVAEKTLFIMVRFFMGFFMYYTVYKFLTTKLHKTNKNTIFFISLFSGFIYSFNPIATTFNSTEAILAFSYSLIPLVFYFFDRAISKGSFAAIFLSALTITLSYAVVPQFLILLPTFILFPWFIIALIERKTIQEKILPVIKNFFYIIMFSFLLSLYWVLPILSTIYFGSTPQPAYTLTYDFLNIISNKTSLLDVFRLLGDWWPRVEITPIVDTLSWTILSFVLPLTVLSLILFVKKSRLKYYLLAFFMISLFVMFFHKGTQEPISEFYQFLYSIPIFGWMFRVPTIMGQFLAFFITLIIGLGFYEIFSRKISNLNRYLKYIPIFGLVLAVSLVSWPMFSGDLGGVIKPQKMLGEEVNVLKKIQEAESKFFVYPRDKSLYFDLPVLNPQRYQYLKFLESSIEHEKSINYLLSPINAQFLLLHNSIKQSSVENELTKYDYKLSNYTLFENSELPSYIDIPKKNLLVFGGLDRFSTLASLESFNSNDYSVIFSDYDIKTLKKFNSGIDTLIVSDKKNLLMQFLDDESIILTPSEYTKRHKPGKVWSVGATHDPVHGGFHNIIEQFNVTNSDFDYKEGLIFTWVPDIIDIPFEINNEQSNEVFIRFLENQEGGMIEILIDDVLIEKISTESQNNRFVWEQLDSINLSQGKHILTLKNVDGLNAINILTLIPSTKLSIIEEKVDQFVNDARMISMYEAELDFSLRGLETASNDIFNSIDFDSEFTKTITGQWKVPEESTHLALQFLTKQNQNYSSSYEIKNIDIKPIYNQIIFKSDFETEIDKWINSKIGRQNLTTIQNKETLTENLKVDVKASDRINLNTVSTDFIPVYDKVSIDFDITLSAKDVRNFNSKIHYYDKNKELIHSDWLLGLHYGTFDKKVDDVFRTPSDTSYIKLLFRSQANPEKNSYYIIDSVKIGQTYHDIIIDDLFSGIVTKNQMLTFDNESIFFHVEKGITENWTDWKTRPIPVRENMILNYSMEINSKQAGEILSKVIFYKSNLEKLRDFNASNNEVLILNPGSEIFTEFDVLKSSNYTIAAKIMKCEKCSNLEIRVDGLHKKFPINNTNEDSKWVYYSIPLEKGKKELVIHSENKSAVDSVVIYSDSYDKETLSDLFSTKEGNTIVENFKKVDPTLYKVKLSSVPEGPFMLSFAEPYNQLWEASFANKSYFSTPLFSIKNGFWIEQANEVEITIEYIPQKWFYLGSAITSITIILSVIRIAFIRSNLKN